MNRAEGTNDNNHDKGRMQPAKSIVMIWHRVRRFVCFALVGSIIALIVFSEWIHSTDALGGLRMVGNEIQAACRDAGTQWMVMVCLVSYFVTFLFLERKLFQPQSNPKNAKVETAPPTSDFWFPSSISAFLVFLRGNIWNSNFWLVGLVGLVLLPYAFAYETASHSLQPIVLLTGIVFGKGIALWVGWGDSKLRPLTPFAAERESETQRRIIWILFVLCTLLGASALLQSEHGMEFQYRGQRRWTGAWDNPNIYGLLMGVGLTLTIGLLVPSLKSKGQSPGNTQRGVGSAESWRWVKIVLLLTSAGVCALGLVRSYSRGAWLGTAVGIGFLIWQSFNGEPSVTRNQTGRNLLLRHDRILRLMNQVRLNWLPLFMLLASIIILTLWQFRHTENPLARRMFSIGNPNDFSWRNRVSTWAGAITMMKDRPFVGYGWGKSEAVFREKYKPVRLEDTAAIQMNDYLMLGISCGVPASICFVAYLWLSCRGSKGVCRAPDERLTADCRLQTSAVGFAGATVLLVGFWFDGGLFKLTTAAVFWVLVELGQRNRRGNEVQNERAITEKESWSRTRSLTTKCAKSEIILRWLTGILALLAVGQTVLHISTPQLTVSQRTLSIARKFFVPPKQKQDFEFLATQPIWSTKQLGTLIEHVELANYNRDLVNWKLDNQLYREFVLSPQIDPGWDGQMNWRRPLWESFYPRIRKESSLAAATAIIIRHLRERVRSVETHIGPETIIEIWRRGSASERGFEVISVAALRSAGIPARLAERGRAEFWNGGEWQPLH